MSPWSTHLLISTKSNPLYWPFIWVSGHSVEHGAFSYPEVKMSLCSIWYPPGHLWHMAWSMVHSLRLTIHMFVPIGMHWNDNGRVHVVPLCLIAYAINTTGNTFWIVAFILMSFMTERTCLSASKRLSFHIVEKGLQAVHILRFIK